ncbi:hypothetical protein COW36_21390 [bacterium (Candidatus Blackallbacteria) CG17_big_fil_post_rev_8_21_14_2_50_48_46]|uniref:Uncharacterized protein n=1 Tax=bacterium (Candidatus Blackallbacteria) CG17_big_fil_post_rev_8_21_14_2_50_48_46 TaxID=2014261 RepID=A0A2M7FYZ7_9BACT|nr:MAG: hypothetical protein COW64_14690 [bacterium (Candidatus Blackallbacteria) CG18_big_fil_WC_8_21_14_2_50_49_26]PIW14593.1 MAG: hypothetical protein COW36_21390 [bacterium (Candidatus Blackallbacteria) CG17_big_fil_post_rev_8_21_14_2_50_48_46]PIW45644.1 MAG: hypothetical protein COW20_19220 [bacterium (Candidatus Blackallbacteria) CG13_big_fil_rev_8_21_14_2_50_49_14]
MKPVVVGLVQMNQRFFEQSFLPYSTALLQAQVQAHSPRPERYLFLLPVFLIMSADSALPQLMAADIVGFSVYVWNLQHSLALAKALKARKPSVRIVFGGPQVPNRAEAFLREHPQVDLCCHGPGEAVFLELLERFPEKDWQAIPGTSYLDEQGRFQSFAQAPWKRDLAALASPYLQGTLDPLISLYPGESWVAPWETNRGCPFSCAFCDWGSATGSKVLQFPLEKLQAELHWFGERKIASLMCCDANFGMLKRDEELVEELIQVRQGTGFPQDIHTQSAKNATERVFRIQKTLSENGLSRGATLSFQSLDAQALRDIQRENISLESYRELQQRFKQVGVPTYTDLLIGVPGETVASFLRGLETVIRGGQHEQVRFYEISLLPNAPMAQPEYRSQHQLETVWVPAVVPWDKVVAVSNDDERYELVIGSKSYSRKDWREMRIMAWLIDLLYFYHRALQMPLLFLIALEQLSLATLLQNWMQLSAEAYPLSAEIRAFFERRALGIQAGEPLYSPGPAVPGQKEQRWLSAINLIYCGLIENHLLERFFEECGRWLETERKNSSGQRVSAEVLQQSVGLCSEAFKASYYLPAREQHLNWNLEEVYQGLLKGETLALRETSRVFQPRGGGAYWLESPVLSV